MNRRAAFALAALLLILLAVSVAAEAWLLPGGIARTTATFPEVEPLASLAIAWGIVAISCCQVILIIGLRLVALARDAKRFYASAHRWLRAIVGCLLLLVALVIAAIVRLSMTGHSTTLMLWLAMAGTPALIAAVVLSASRMTRRPRRRASAA